MSEWWGMDYANSLAFALTGALFVAIGEVARVSIEVTREVRASNAKRKKDIADGKDPAGRVTLKGVLQGIRIIISAFGAVVLAIGSFIALFGE